MLFCKISRIWDPGKIRCSAVTGYSFLVKIAVLLITGSLPRKILVRSWKKELFFRVIDSNPSSRRAVLQICAILDLRGVLQTASKSL